MAGGTGMLTGERPDPFSGDKKLHFFLVHFRHRHKTGPRVETPGEAPGALTGTSPSMKKGLIPPSGFL